MQHGSTCKRDLTGSRLAFMAASGLRAPLHTRQDTLLPTNIMLGYGLSSSAVPDASGRYPQIRATFWCTARRERSQARARTVADTQPHASASPQRWARNSVARSAQECLQRAMLAAPQSHLAIREQRSPRRTRSSTRPAARPDASCDLKVIACSSISLAFVPAASFELLNVTQSSPPR